MPEGDGGVIWSPEAIDDVDCLWDHLFHAAGPTTADKMLREIQRVVTVLVEFPQAGRSRGELQPGLRSMPIGNQIVFYRVAKDGPQIVRVLDGRRDITGVFADENPWLE